MTLSTLRAGALAAGLALSWRTPPPTTRTRVTAVARTSAPSFTIN
jgi:hypothetical protein